MEQRKVLIIVISVSAFLAIVLGVGMFWFYPRPKPELPATAVAPTPGVDYDPIEWVRTRDDVPPLTPDEEATPKDPAADVIIVYGDSPTDSARPGPAAPPATATKPPAAAPPAIARVTTAPVQRARPAPTPKTVRVREFSIQAGSFASRDKAELAARTLRGKGLVPSISIKTISGTDYFRLRVGPYQNRAEAEKFLTWIRDIPGFQESMIFEGWGTRTVNS